MKYGRIVNDIVVEIVEQDPTQLFHPDIAVEFEAVDPSVQQGYIKQPGGGFVAPEEVVIAPVEQYASVTPIQFKLLWTAPERLHLKSLKATDPVIEDFYDLMDDPRLTEVDMRLQSVRDGIDYCLAKLEEATIIAPEDVETRKADITSGVFL